MKQSLKFALSAWMCFSVLTGCKALDELILPLSESEKLEREIELERKKQELERLRRAGQPTPTPTAATPSGAPAVVNQSPQIQILDAVLATTVKNNDTVRIVVKASDADGDAVEYNWSSVYNGLSSTKGEQVVWFPGDQKLACKTNIITVSVTDKKGGTSTASLNIFVQNDGTLLVREDTAHKPVLSSLLATRTDDGRVLLRATASDPAGGLLKYSWSSTAGQLASPESASTIWQPASASGQVQISLVVSNAAGLQTAGSFAFERQADGSLIGGFTGTDVTLPGGSTTLPGGSLDSDLQVVGDLLVLAGEELVRINPRTRTRSTLLKMADLPKTAGITTQKPERLLFDGKQATLVAMEFRQVPNALLTLFSIDPVSGKATRGQSLIEKSLINEKVLSFFYSLYFPFHGQTAGFFTLSRETWLMDFDGNLQTQLPAGLKPLAVSPAGKVLVQTTAGKLGLYEPDTGNQSELFDPASVGLPVNGFGQFVWNHKGDRVAFTLTSGAPGGQAGGDNVYTLDMKGKLETIKNNAKQTDLRDLAFSLDDLYVSFVEYPYVYLQSPSDRRSRIGYLNLIALDRPDQPIVTKLDFYESNLNQMVWVP
ncbi:MAG: hypothetical protein ACAI44_18645 [Candidatus Sericytochromatia bacterium]